jgi:hypothetical protein
LLFILIFAGICLVCFISPPSRTNISMPNI